MKISNERFTQTRVVVCVSLANNLYTARLLFRICHSKGSDLSSSFVAASILLSIWETKSVCSADRHFAQKEEQGGSPQSHPSTQIWINSGQSAVSRYVWGYAILIPKLLRIIKRLLFFALSNFYLSLLSSRIRNMCEWFVIHFVHHILYSLL